MVLVSNLNIFDSFLGMILDSKIVNCQYLHWLLKFECFLAPAVQDIEVEAPKIGKRTNYIKWEDYFMSMALLAAQRSKDPNTQVCLFSL